MDLNERRYTKEVLHSNNVHLRTVLHELWRMGHGNTDGMSEKEVKYLNRQADTIREAADNLSKLRNRLHKSS